jgi:hypothetical protein
MAADKTGAAGYKNPHMAFRRHSSRTFFSIHIVNRITLCALTCFSKTAVAQKTGFSQ